jgi:hypothetical protein
MTALLHSKTCNLQQRIDQDRQGKQAREGWTNHTDNHPENDNFICSMTKNMNPQ